MSNATLKELLEQLHEALAETTLDGETRELVTALDSEIHALLQSGESEQELRSTHDRAQLLEARFAVEHPTAERFLREMIDTLARMGI